MRDVRDYRIHSSAERTVITGGSAFNIEARSLRLGDFSETEVRALLAQHTEETGGGYVEREYGLGRGRVDLLIVWPQGGRQRRFVVECKVVHKGLERTIREGVAQTVRYLERSAAESGHLVVFDRGAGSWDEKIFRREQQAGGRRIVVWGM